MPRRPADLDCELSIVLKTGRFQPPDWALALCRAAEDHPRMRARRRGWPWAPRWTFDGPGPHLRCVPRWNGHEPHPATHRPLRPRAGIAFELVLADDFAVFRAHPGVFDPDALQAAADATLRALRTDRAGGAPR